MQRSLHATSNPTSPSGPKYSTFRPSLIARTPKKHGARPDDNDPSYTYSPPASPMSPHQFGFWVEEHLPLYCPHCRKQIKMYTQSNMPKVDGGCDFHNHRPIPYQLKTSNDPNHRYFKVRGVSKFATLSKPKKDSFLGIEADMGLLLIQYNIDDDGYYNIDSSNSAAIIPNKGVSTPYKRIGNSKRVTWKDTDVTRYPISAVIDKDDMQFSLQRVYNQVPASPMLSRSQYKQYLNHSHSPLPIKKRGRPSRNSLPPKKRGCRRAISFSLS